MTDQQLADRFEAAELPAWENDASFQQLLLSFESILPLRQRSEFRDPKVHQRILSLTEGVLVRICRLLETAASEAIRGGQEHISLTLLKDDLVAESLVSIVDRATGAPHPDDHNACSAAATVRTKALPQRAVLVLAPSPCSCQLCLP